MCGLPVRSQQDITIRVCWALWAFAAVVVLGRFAARSKSFNGVGYGWDDWTAAVTMVFVTGIAISGYLMIRDGLGRDIWQLQPRNISAVLRVSSLRWYRQASFSLINSSGFGSRKSCTALQSA